MAKWQRKLKEPAIRQNLYLTNMELLKKMAEGWNYSGFVDELIAREYRRRKKTTQPANKSSLTAS